MNLVALSCLSFLAAVHSAPLMAGNPPENGFVSALKEKNALDSLPEGYGVFAVGKKDRVVHLYFWNSDSSGKVPQKALVSENFDKDRDNEYSVSDLTLVNQGDYKGGKVFQFSLGKVAVDDGSSLFVNSLRWSYGTPDEVDYKVATEYRFDGEDISSASYPTEQVTDKLVSYWNVAEGHGDAVKEFFAGKQRKAYSEHYLAFNFSVEMDRILSIGIHTDWKAYLGRYEFIDYHVPLSESARTVVWFPSDYLKEGANMKIYADWVDSGKYRDVGLSSFELLRESYTPSHMKRNIYVYPKDVERTTFKSLFGFKYNFSQFRWNTIEKLSDVGRYRDFTDRFRSIFGEDGYSKVSDSLWDSEHDRPKFQWFVNFAETPLAPEFTLVFNQQQPPDMKLSKEYVEFGSDCPFVLAQDTSVVEIRYEKAGKNYKSFVLDRAQDSTPDPITPFIPDENGNNWDWLFYLLCVLAVCALMGAVAFLLPVFRYFAKGLVLLFKALVVILYFPFWAIRALAAGIEKRKTPELWFWR